MKKQNGTVRHVVRQDAATLVYLAIQACITPHVWISRMDKPNHPDPMISDLDPPDGDFPAVCRAAVTLRALLERENPEPIPLRRTHSPGRRMCHVCYANGSCSDVAKGFSNSATMETLPSGACIRSTRWPRIRSSFGQSGSRGNRVMGIHSAEGAPGCSGRGAGIGASGVA
jgi:LigD-like primase-polymerase